MTPAERELRDRVDALERENASLRARLEQALAENERLRRALDEARRAGKRQAAPYSRNTPKANPKPPGRKAGAQYGSHAERREPDRVDERIPVPLPATCDRCGGRVVRSDTRPQFQEDIVRHTVCARKTWGGNRTDAGARAQQILA